MRGKLRNPFAIDKSGLTVHVDAYTAAMKGNLACPKCSLHLIWRNGPKKQKHFAHKRRSSDCIGAAETGLHRFAKQLIARVRRLHIPPLVDVTTKTPLGATKEHFFDSSATEVPYDNRAVIVDVVLSGANGTLGVEIAVTHKVDGEKLERLKRLDLSVVEIRLDRERCIELSQAELESEILTNGARTLLHHKNAALIQSRYRKAEALAERARLQAEADADFYKGRKIRRRPIAAFDPDYKRDPRVQAPLFGKHIGLECEGGIWFNDPASIWQEKLMISNIILPSAKTFLRGQPTVISIRPPEALLKAELRKPPSDALLSGLGMSRHEIGSPEGAVASYLAACCEVGGLVLQRSEGVFEVHPEVAALCFRRAELRRLALLCCRSEHSYVVNRRYREFRKQYLPKYNGTPVEIAEEGGAKWDELAVKLYKIVEWLDGGAAEPSDLLLLDLHPTINARRRVDRAMKLLSPKQKREKTAVKTDGMSSEFVEMRLRDALKALGIASTDPSAEYELSIPRDWLEGRSLKAYNLSKSDVVSRINRRLGAVDAFGRPLLR